MGVIRLARQVLEIESQAIAALVERIGEEFLRAVELLVTCPGKLIVTGMGKSGLVGKKIASTFASIGTPALFLHPAEAIHGDVGMVVRGDVVITISNSGETEEIIRLLPSLKRFGVQVITICGNGNSTLAKRSDVVLDATVKEEACPLGVVPTASTAAAMAMGDALVMAVLERKGIKREDFALLHPGGTLGRKLLLTVGDLMHTGAEVPVVREEALFKDVILEISSKKLGVTSVVNQQGQLSGTITDGDLRRLMERSPDLFAIRAVNFMTPHPKVIGSDALAARAVQVMEQHAITSLLIVDQHRIPVGIIHLHDLLKAGVV